MRTDRISEIMVECLCKKVKLNLIGLNPEFVACHCGTCQFLHAGPGFGAHCNDVKILGGGEFITLCCIVKIDRP